MTLWQHLYWAHQLPKAFLWDEEAARTAHRNLHIGCGHRRPSHLLKDLSFEGDSKPMATDGKPQLFRVPEILGGGEYQLDPNTRGHEVWSLLVPGVGSVAFPKASLTKVEPPLPPEPGDRSVVRAGNSRVYERNDAQATTDRNFARRWFSPGLVAGATWEYVCSLGPVFLLVPNPLDDAPELPYDHRDTDGDRVEVGTGDGDGDDVLLSFGGGEYEVEVDRTFALAVLKATTPST